MAADRLAEVQQRIGYRFKDPMLLRKAITHSSMESYNYERLEFLGDRVVGLVIADTLFRAFPEESEGALAKRLAALAQGSMLARLATRLGLGDMVILSEAERAAGGALNENILGDALEGVIGAMYLDGGIDPCRTFITDLWGDAFLTMTEPPQDPKTALQEWAQARGLPLPAYRIVDRQGPDHAPIFTIAVSVTGDTEAEAQGPSRRHAEKEAARRLLTLMKDRDNAI